MGKGPKKGKKKDGKKKKKDDSLNNAVPTGSNGETAEDVLYQQSMEARVEGLKVRCEKLRTENSSLKETAGKNEKDTHEFVAYFQNEIEKKDLTISKLTEQLSSQAVEFEKEITFVKDNCRSQVSKAETELTETRAKLEAKVKVLEDELAVLTEYKHKRDLLHSKLSDAEDRLTEQAAAHKTSMNDLERQFIEKHAKLQRDMQHRIEGIKKKAREDAQEGLDADTRKIIADNKRMGEELRFQLQTSDELQQQGRILIEENKRLKRNLALAHEKEHEYASRGYYKENELQTAKQKIKSLERNISQTIRDFERNKAEADQENSKRFEDLELEVAGLKQLVKLKNKELKNIRQLSQVILDQRTEVEQFFLEALEQVKKEIRKQRQEEAKRSAYEYSKQLRMAQKGNASVKFPNIRPARGEGQQSGGSTSSRIGLVRGVKIELQDLSWEDRERVLRLLFAKLNAVENQQGDLLRDAASAGFAGYATHEQLVPYSRPSTTEPEEQQSEGLLLEQNFPPEPAVVKSDAGTGGLFLTS